MMEKVGDQTQQLKQLGNVPEWARAGASHSQTAKDHAGSPFFGVAFKVANQADTMLMESMKKAWAEANPAWANPDEKLDGNYGEKDADGKQVFDPPKEPGGKPRPKLKDEEGLSEWEKQARRKFIENRVMGEDTARDGVAPDESLGKSLTGMADKLVKVIEAYPVLGPMFDELIRKIRADEEAHEIVEELEKAAAAFNEYANSGKLDDDAIDEVDNLIAMGRWALKHKKDDHSEHSEHEGTEDHGDHKDHEDHDEHGGLEGQKTHNQEQIDLLDKYRAAGGTNWKDHKAKRTGTGEDGKPIYSGVMVDSLNERVKVGQNAPLDKAAEGAKTAQERFRADVDRIFGHPYDSNWWVETVQKWAKQNPHVLAQYIHDRNAGHQHIH
jgi:hypothetical protein